MNGCGSSAVQTCTNHGRWTSLTCQDLIRVQGFNQGFGGSFAQIASQVSGCFCLPRRGRALPATSTTAKGLLGFGPSHYTETQNA